jgi:hypothetical protein
MYLLEREWNLSGEMTGAVISPDMLAARHA